MKQVFLAGDGQVEVLDAPIPARLKDSSLVRNAYTLISSGTEGAAVTRRGGVLGIYEKALQSRHRIKLVWQMAKSQGIIRTFGQVKGKLADYAPLGYSAAGVIVESDTAGLGLSPGEKIAYMGTGLANHAEYGVATKLLSAKVPDHVPLDQASFAALAAIAMQGIRRTELTPGERLVIVGLGLIGQLAVRLAVAMGYQVFGTDLNTHRLGIAEKAGACVWGPDEKDSVRFSKGIGFDSALICAGSNESKLVNNTFDLLRKGGRVSVVGNVGLNIDRSKMYRKELELRISCSYGPGRYDPEYEFAGNDYPIQHARWTEGRNLEYFIDLLARGTLDVSDLVNSVHPVAEAKAAFAEVKEAQPEVFGILLDHGLPVELEKPEVAERSLHLVKSPSITQAKGPVRIGVIGAGGYAKAVHLPNLVKLEKDFRITWLSSRSSVTGVARRFNPEAVTSDYRRVLDDTSTEAVLIAVRHAMHAQILTEALEAGKHVYIEKPMTRTVLEARGVADLAKEAGRVVRVGFNRRFSPDMGYLRAATGATENGPIQFLVRCNTGSLKGDWSNTEHEGGRLLGECTHFFDLANWFMGAKLERLSASIVGEDLITNPNAVITIDYSGGKTALILYSALGNKAMGKEYFEVFGQGVSGYCKDFQKTKVFGGDRWLNADGTKPGKGDKGQLAALGEFAARIRGREHPNEGADAQDGLMATWMAWAARESARRGNSIPCLAKLDVELEELEEESR
jgi:predicted dehydrogenase/threonine dehydrogenase-like Zn-dependent dehydrogenase